MGIFIPTEEQMVEIFLRNWKESERQKSLFVREVRINQKKIYLIQIPKYKNNHLGIGHAIEFKLKNWKDCLNQAKKNRLFMPMNTIAIWKTYISEVKKEDLIEEGIGLIEVSKKKNRTILKPQRSQFTDRFLYSKLRKQILRDEMGKK